MRLSFIPMEFRNDHHQVAVQNGQILAQYSVGHYWRYVTQLRSISKHSIDFNSEAAVTCRLLLFSSKETERVSSEPPHCSSVNSTDGHLEEILETVNNHRRAHLRLLCKSVLP